MSFIGPTPLDCHPCGMSRGEIAAVAGQSALADRWFGEAVTRTRYFTHTWIPGEGGWQIFGGMCRDVPSN